jgi:hypothetical protein
MRPLRQAAGRGQGTRCRRSLGTSLIGIANLSGLSHHGEGIMTESAEQVTLNLPQLKKKLVLGVGPERDSPHPAHL